MARLRVSIGSAFVVLGFAVVTAAAGQFPFAIQRFDEQIASYMSVRRGIEARVGVPTVSSDASNIIEMENALAHGIRQARPRAQAGDIFTADVGVEFRRRIRHALELRGVSESGLLTDLRREAPDAFCTVAVNGNFDWRFGVMMPTVVIEALPELPWPLQYRFACRDLVLLDVDAGLVIDILPDALSAP